MPAGPRPQIPSFSGPCYNSQCVQFRSQLIASAQAAQAQWDYQYESERATEIVSQQQAALTTQIAEEAKVKAQYEQIVKETQQQAGVAKKQSQASVAQQRVQARNAMAMQATSEQQQQQTTQRTKKTAQNVGQPGVSRTRVSSRFGIGGYGGTAPGRVNPTGLNI
jgi:hypothetical protein